jgi:hypothetical protein
LKAFVAVTDNDWFGFLAGLSGIDEVNFWQPGGVRHFRGDRDLAKAPVKTGMVQEVKVFYKVRASWPLLRQAQYRFGLKLRVDDS